MQCDICFRTGGSRLPFLCSTDARNRLYDPRIQNAQILLENDALEQQISTLVSAQAVGQDNERDERPDSGLKLSSILAEKDQVVDRTRQIITQADELRAKVQTARDEITERKALLSRRKSDLASASNGIDARRTRQVEEVEKSVRMTKYKWNQGHATMAASRAFLCGEAAKLYGLKRQKKSAGPDEYRIGGITIVDLRAMNTATPAQISTALSHIVHLLMLCTHYLAIRLPAEITLPHRDYPLTTIFPIASSYKHTDVPFPGISGQSSNTSPTNSRHPEQSKDQPRPRPLFTQKPLPAIAKDDPAGYSLFLEGVMLLAYNVVWLCKSQGIPVGNETDGTKFEDVCDIGKNLYNLLIGSRPRPAPTSRVPSIQSTPTKGGQDGEVEAEDRKTFTASMGKYSHGAAHSFLGNSEGSAFTRSWQIPKLALLVDTLKARLMSEVANAEWELLNPDAWQVDDEMGVDGVVVGARNEGIRTQGMLGMQSFMSMRTVMDAVEMVSGDGERKPGTSGWTKLKPR